MVLTQTKPACTVAIPWLVVAPVTLFNAKLLPGDVVVPAVLVPAGALLVIAMSQSLNLRRAIGFTLLCTIPLASIGNVVSYSNFLTSYCMWVLVSAAAVFPTYTLSVSSRETVEKTIEYFLVVIRFASIIGIVQFGVNNYTSVQLYDFYGPLQAHAHADNAVSGIQRATSIFIEPSFFGWVMLVSIALYTYLKRYRLITSKRFYFGILICGAGLICSFSASAFVGVLLFAIGVNFRYVKTTGSVVLAGFLISMLTTGALALAADFLRLSSVMVEGSSGYARVLVPWLSVQDALAVYPFFGRGLGQQDIEDFRLTFSGLPIFNAAFGFWVVFGILGGILVASSLYWSLRKTVSAIPGKALLFFPFLYYYFVTGSFVSLENIFILYILISAGTLAQFRRDPIWLAPENK
jgi:hypothetical protein